jgi:hypothetical protein
MHEFKHGELESGSGRKVRNPKQAIAIALSESGQSRNKRDRRPAGKSTRSRSTDRASRRANSASQRRKSASRRKARG